MLASIYITQYIGVAFIMSAAVAILRQQGIALDKLALLNLIALPLLGKVFYAPIIDKYRFLLQGTYRSWLILSQAGMVALLFLAGSLDIALDFSAIIIVLAVYVLFMSIQDVAVDGLSCKLFSPDARKLASSIQFSGNLLGNIIGGGLILMFYPWLEWHGSLWLLATLTGLTLIQLILFKEPNGMTENTEPTSIPRHLLHDMKGFIKQHKHWFMIMALYPIGSTCGFALLNPMLVDSGWQLDEIGFAMKIFGSIVGLFSALLATPFINKVGRRKTLVSTIIIQSIALALILPITLGFTEKVVIYLAIGVHFISFPMLLVVSATMIMDKAANTQRRATFFALQFSFSSLLGFIYSAISMAIAKHAGYFNVVISGAALTFAIAILVWFLLKNAQNSAPTFKAQPASAA